MRGLLSLLGIVAGFGAIVALHRARVPFGAWSRATGTRSGAFLPAVWWRLARNPEMTPDLEDARRAARFWIGFAIGLLALGLTLVVTAAIAA
jgi:hypothetical protein